MDLNKLLVDNYPDEYFAMANEYLQNLLASNPIIEEIDLINVASIRKTNKSIAVLIWHSHFPVPCIEIELEIWSEGNILPIGLYRLLVDVNKSFIDEFFIIK